MRLKKMLIFSLILTIFAVGCKKDEENNTTNNGNNTENPTPPADENTVKDIDGNIYKTVNINGKTWMAENLKVEKLNDGSTLRPFTGERDWEQANMATTGGFGYYNGDNANKNEYGALYDKQAAHNGKLCPTGWHVPSKAEWNALISFVGEEMNEETSAKLRTVNGWEDSEGNAIAGTDEYGFAAKPAGSFAANSAEFWGLKTCTTWWTSEDFYTFIMTDGAATTNTLWEQNNKNYDGYSVRCVKD